MKKFTRSFVAVMVCCSLTITTPVLAQNETNRETNQMADRNDDDDTGKWGLLGLVGLLGLLGLKRRDDDNKIRVSKNP